MDRILIRVATPEDGEALLQIYAPYVRDTAVTFEYEVPSLEEFRARMAKVQEKFPYLVAERRGELVGYTYASPFHSRSAYQWAVETTIYIRRDCRRQGIGEALYEALEKALRAQNILNLNACIGYPETEDEYLTADSMKFHERQGYRLVGEFSKCGYKFGKWYNMVWMEKHIGEHGENPRLVRTFAQIEG